MDAEDWDRRYAASDLVWSAEPNQWVVDLLGTATPGVALDVAAGEGRNALWLAAQGWTVTACDYSRVAIERLRTLSEHRPEVDPAQVTAIVADATEALPVPSGSADLALLCYLQLPADQWRAALRNAVKATRRGGQIVVIGHALQNLTEGWGGPQDAAVLYDPEQVVAAARSLRAEVTSAEIRIRVVVDEAGEHRALDTVVVLTRI